MPEPTDRPLPESYLACRDSDEAFWQDQERNIQGALGQPCCTLSGIASGLMHLPGRFAVVVHGEDECASCFRHVGPAAVQFYCTGLTEHEFITGQTAEPLRLCLRLIAEKDAPEAIFVLGACPVEVIGDRFETVVASVAREFPDIPMVALHTSGLKVGTQTAMLDWMFESLASLPVIDPVDRLTRKRLRSAAYQTILTSMERSPAGLGSSVQQVADALTAAPPSPADFVNLLGLPRSRLRNGAPEYMQALEAAGLRVMANFPQDATFEDWRSIRFPKATFVADRTVYPKLIQTLEASGQTVSEVPLPVGLMQTDQFYATLGEVTGRAEAIQAFVAPARAAAVARLEAFRARFSGLRLAYGLRMVNNYEADQLAYAGLGDFWAMPELGLDVTLLVQGPPDKRDRFEKMFERRGIHLPFEMFVEPWILGDLLTKGSYDVAYLADHCRPEARKAGVPMIISRTMELYYTGVVQNLEKFEILLHEATRR